MRSLARVLWSTLAISAFASGSPASAQDADLAKQLSNPIASLISVPFQFNYDEGFGPNDGEKATLNIQPVIPVSLNADWTMISRTILPVIWQNDVAGPSGEQFGLGDITQSLFFSPKNPGPSGIVWGVGPVFLVPTATDDLLGGGKWGAGPTAVVLKQYGGWTVGALANHIWSFAGDGDRSDIISTFLQPFVSYTTKDAWTFTLNTENTYNWEAEEWSVPVNFQVA
ncbi:MAG: transporter, partial [Mesorhizobium sp.]